MHEIKAWKWLLPAKLDTNIKSNKVTRMTTSIHPSNAKKNALLVSSPRGRPTTRARGWPWHLSFSLSLTDPTSSKNNHVHTCVRAGLQTARPSFKKKTTQTARPGRHVLGWAIFRDDDTMTRMPASTKSPRTENTKQELVSLISLLFPPRIIQIYETVSWWRRCEIQGI